jgi:acyl carrier protein
MPGVELMVSKVLGWGGQSSPGRMLYPPSHAAMSDALTTQVIEAIARVKRIPAEQVKLESTFEELGIDSLDGMNILFELENDFDINVPDAQAKSLRNVREVVDGVRTLIAEKQRPTGTSH